jgi:hypothetical protein
MGFKLQVFLTSNIVPGQIVFSLIQGIISIGIVKGNSDRLIFPTWQNHFDAGTKIIRRGQKLNDDGNFMARHIEFNGL